MENLPQRNKSSTAETEGELAGTQPIQGEFKRFQKNM